MRFGEARDYIGKEDHFFQKLESFGEAIFDRQIRWAPKEARDFTKSQYERFNIPVPFGYEFLYEYGVALVHTYLNYMDPYALYWELSDVELTSDWEKYTYEFVQDTVVDRGPVELDPEKLETFRFVPGQAEKFFEEYISKPGFGSLPQFLTASIADFHEDFVNDTVSADWFSADDMGSEMWRKVEGLCTENGEINHIKVKAYFDLSLWAGALWWFGPLSREFRISFSDLQETAIMEGEAIVYEGEVLGPKYYRKVLRPPQSCHRCGLDAWCVEDTIDDSSIARLICEGCLSKDMPRYDGATCGSKFCKYFSCPYNSWYQNPTGHMGAMRNTGQLAAKAREAAQVREALMPSERKLING